MDFNIWPETVYVVQGVFGVMVTRERLKRRIGLTGLAAGIEHVLMGVGKCFSF